MGLYLVGLVWNIYLIHWTKREVGPLEHLPKLIITMLFLNILAMLTHHILFGFYIAHPESYGQDYGLSGENSTIGHAENIIKLLNNMLLLVSMNIALNNWVSYDFQVGKQI